MGGLSLHDYLIVTDRRVIFWGRGLMSDSSDAFLLADIASVEGEQGLLLGEITLNVAGAKERCANIPKADVPIATEMIRKQINQARTNARGLPQSAAPPMTESIPDQIRTLADLKNSGILTAEEFEAKKKDLLSRM